MIGVGVTVRRTGSMLSQLAKRAQNPAGLLKQAALYLKLEAQDKIASGEGFAPWAESTRKKYEQTGTSKIAATGAVRASYARRLDVYLRRKGGDDARAELRKMLAGGRLDASRNGPAARTLERLQARRDKAAAQIASGKRINIGKRKAEKHTLLGQLVKTWSQRLVGRTAIVLRNYAGFSGVQNEGGTVGKGAVVPERRFLEITADARRWIAQRTLDYLLR